MVINQGDVFWVDLGMPSGSAPEYRRPYVVIQNNLFNHSRIDTVVICAITSNLRYAPMQGNVLLRQGEANLPKESVANISQLYTVDKQELIEKIGTLKPQRVKQIIEGIRLLTEPL